MSSKLTNKKLRVFAGPNGSGKSTLINEIRSQFNIGLYVNADDILASFQSKSYFDYSFILKDKIIQAEWNEFVIRQKRPNSISLTKLRISDYFMLSEAQLNGYDASIIADFFRERLLISDYNFSFETVMSHFSKIDFMRKARANGFKVYYYFICTSDPDINLNRVANRIKQGGHAVDPEKIVSRYFRCLQLLSNAFLVADRAFVIDTTYGFSEVIVEKNGIDVKVLKAEVPQWVEEYLLKNLNEAA
jgi:predicted ABC-type ATPase